MGKGLLLMAALVGCDNESMAPLDLSVPEDLAIAPDLSAAADLQIVDLYLPPPAHTGDGAILPGPPATTCSLNGNTASSITFVNNSSASITTWWVNYQCDEVWYHQVGPGQSYMQNTHTTYPWRIRDAATMALLKEYAGNTDANPVTVTYP